MRKGSNAIWITAFICLLVVNLAVVISTRTSSKREEATPDEGLLLPATDEVELSWWPEVVKPEPGVEIAQPSNVSMRMIRPAIALAVMANVVQPADYPALMAIYIANLRKYLIAYFHITPHRLEVAEE